LAGRRNAVCHVGFFACDLDFANDRLRSISLEIACQIVAGASSRRRLRAWHSTSIRSQLRRQRMKRDRLPGKIPVLRTATSPHLPYYGTLQLAAYWSFGCLARSIIGRRPARPRRLVLTLADGAVLDRRASC
jgi:hypothetical protein